MAALQAEAFPQHPSPSEHSKLNPGMQPCLDKDEAILLNAKMVIISTKIKFFMVILNVIFFMMLKVCVKNHYLRPPFVFISYYQFTKICFYYYPVFVFWKFLQVQMKSLDYHPLIIYTD
jgi:hypothetical protein